jgi:putative transposase
LRDAELPTQSVPGATYFFTVNLRDHRSSLLVTYIHAHRDAVRDVRGHWPFHIEAWVVSPDHMHCLWTLPAGDSDFPNRWRRIKAGFSKSLPDAGNGLRANLPEGERGIWQRGYWEHTIRDDRDYAVHLNYIHFNPVKHGLANNPSEWPFSSFRQCVVAGLYPADWLGGGDEPMETGER